MARNLSSTINDVFHLYRARNGSVSGIAPVNPKTLYLEVPVNSSTFEVPCFVLNSVNLTDMLNSETEAVVISLNTLNRTPSYSTLSTYMRDVLLDNFKSHRLIKLTTKDSSGIEEYYYATYGAIFNASFKPLLMCSCLAEKYKKGDIWDYKLTKSIARIDPMCYLNKGNPIEKFIAGKFIQTVLTGVDFYDAKLTRSIHVEIDDSPFKLKQPEAPSISTTNELLLKLAETHIDEVFE